MSDNHMENSQAGNSTNTVWQIVGRLITAGIVLAITAFFTPGFEISNFWSLAIATIVLIVISFDLFISSFPLVNNMKFNIL